VAVADTDDVPLGDELPVWLLVPVVEGLAVAVADTVDVPLADDVPVRMPSRWACL